MTRWVPIDGCQAWIRKHSAVIQGLTSSFELSKSTAGHPKRICKGSLHSLLEKPTSNSTTGIFHQSGESEESGLCRK